jgi:hypothetical protein
MGQEVKVDLQKSFKLSTLVIVVGVALAVFGKVRSGSILLALGLSAYTYLRYTILGMKRRIELFLPLGIAGVLLVVAFILPHAR